jgi:hypothetical protein
MPSRVFYRMSSPPSIHHYSPLLFCNWTHHLTTRTGCELTTRFLAQTPPNILPAQTFLTRFLSLLQPASSILSVEGSDVLITSSPTLNFLQMAILTCQRAPAQGVSGVQARGTDGGVGREWEGLVGRYRRVSGAQGVLAQKEVLEVSPYRRDRREEIPDWDSELIVGIGTDLQGCLPHPSAGRWGAGRYAPESHGVALWRWRRRR